MRYLWMLGKLHVSAVSTIGVGPRCGDIDILCCYSCCLTLVINTSQLSVQYLQICWNTKAETIHFHKEQPIQLSIEEYAKTGFHPN